MKKNILAFIFAWSFVTIFAQTSVPAYSIQLPYSCGFEKSEDLSQWVFNAGPDGVNCMDQWMVGNCDNYEGYQSLYITSDTGQTVNYGYKPNYVIAYRPFQITDTLSSSPRFRINVSFAWKGMGVRNYTYARFYLVPANKFENILNSSSSSSRLSKEFKTSTDDFASAPNWEYYSHSENIKTNTKYYMIFVWVNSNDDKELNELSFCIDDLQITNADCGTPTINDVVVTGDTMTISWDAPHTNFDLEYKLSSQIRWKRISNIQVIGGQSKQYVLTGLDEGVYDVRVRGLCPDINLESAWFSQTGIVVYLPERHCINYVELDDPERVQCLIGRGVYTDDPDLGSHLGYTGFGLGAGPIDYGPYDIRSRHTVNWKQNEFDPRTGNKLPTIPDGVLASVRLGNWKNGYEGDGIVFEYHVDTSITDIILLKYAIVLEAPGHGPLEDPFFRLQVVDKQTGEVVHTRCGSFDFSPTDSKVKWEKYRANVWKPWSSMGLNLAPYHGRDVLIRLFTQDCMQGAHFGYAYFALDCINAEIYTNGCGDSFELEMEAPDGFRYEWTAGVDRTKVLSTEKTYNVPTTDTATYYCKLDYIDIDNCSFELSPVAMPRNAHADFTYFISPFGCQNKVTFYNKSEVTISASGVEIPTDEACEDFEWTVGDYISQGEKFDYVFPKEGGDFPVTLKAYISGGMCWDDTTIVVHIDPIMDKDTTIYKKLCDGEYIQFDGKFMMQDTIYTAQDTTWCGCDSLVTLDLKFYPEIEDTYVNVTICTEADYVFSGDGKVYEEGEHEIWLKSQNGCDSIIMLNLVKVPPISVVVEDEYRFVCADEEALYVPYETLAGKRSPFKYSIIYDNFAKGYGFKDSDTLEVDSIGSLFAIALPDSCRPNTYNATIVIRDTVSFCAEESIPIQFDVYYSSSILDAKFNNLITVYDADSNGGYSFVPNEFKWYKNDSLLVEETSSYLFLGEYETFTSGDCYYIEVKRIDDGVIMRSCEICPEPLDPIGVEDVKETEFLISATLLDKGQPILIENFDKGLVNVYSFTGQLIDSYTINSETSEIFAPEIQGFYLLEVITSDYITVYKIYVKDN